MATGPDPVAYEWLRLGVRSALEGNREDARYYFVQAVRTDLDFARAWLYLGGVADDPALTLSCVQKVLKLEPGESQAWAGLIWARNKLGLGALPIPLLPPQPMPPPALAAGPGAPPAPLPVTTPAPPPPAGSERTLLWGGLPAPTRPSEPLAPVAPPEPPGTRPLPPAPVTLPPPAEPEPSGSERLLRRGNRAAVDGDRARARYYFLKAIAADPENVKAWLYLGGVAADPATTLACMERVLRSDPGNPQAQAGAAWAVRKLGFQSTMRWWK